jgi:hypothetical protein
MDQLGMRKGLKVVLKERDIWQPGLHLQCKKSSTNKLNKDCLEGGTCCARALISVQSDFQTQQCHLQDEVENRGHSVLFFPQFHCELNPIEYVWGGAKLFTRNHCGFSIKALRKTIPLALQSVSNSLILKFWNRTERMMRVYCEGIQFGIVEFIQKVKHVRIS